MIYTELTFPEVERLAPSTVAVVPIGSIEQHGHHLPIVTDTALATGVAERTEQALPKQVLLLPTLWVGSSHHHRNFPGTVSLQTSTYIDVLIDIADSLIRSGFKKILFLNGHGGNVYPAREALYQLNLKHCGPDEPWIVSATYWDLSKKDVASAEIMETPFITHACEYETSMMLALRTDWVAMDKAKGDHPTRHSRYYDPMGYEPSRVAVVESFHQMTSTGSLGRPDLATPEKGETLFQIHAASMIDFVQEFMTWKRDS